MSNDDDVKARICRPIAICCGGVLGEMGGEARGWRGGEAAGGDARGWRDGEARRWRLEGDSRRYAGGEGRGVAGGEGKRRRGEGVTREDDVNG
jgi:hypothetical protein